MASDASHYQTWKGIEYRPAVEVWPPSGLFKYLPLGASVLDVGCGEGAVSRLIAEHGAKVTGLDINQHAIEVARSRAQSYASGVKPTYVVGDFFSLELMQEFDALTMIRVLTCLPDFRDWQRALDRVLKTLRPGGLFYVHDFSFDPDNPAYRDRYEFGIRAGWRPGTFEVPREDGELAFLAFHHDDRAIEDLTKPYEVLVLQTHKGVSMNGNAVKMFEFVGRKHSK